MPDFTVIVPCHNQGGFIHECLESVIRQTEPPAEIIIVNDGSTANETAKIEKAAACLSAPCRILSNAAPTGLPSARNQAIKAAETDFILPLDADDKISPSYLEKAGKILRENTNVGVVCGNGVYFGKKKGPAHFPAFSHARMLLDNCIPAMAAFRKKDWEKAGGYDNDFREGWEDWDFYLSMLELGLDYHHLSENVFFYRRHGGNMTNQINKDKERHSRLYRKLVGNHKPYFDQHAAETLILVSEERHEMRQLKKGPFIGLYRKLGKFLKLWPYG